MKKKLCALLVSAMLFCAMPISASAAEQVFTDVTSDAWYYTAVNEAYRAGLVSGVGNGKFEPNRAVTEAELVAMVHRVLADDEDQNPKSSDGKWYSGYYDVWETKFPTKLTWKDPMYQTLVTDWSQFGYIGKSGVELGYCDAHASIYDHTAIPEDMWLEFAEKYVYDDNGNMYPWAEECWNGGYNNVLPKKSVCLNQHMQLSDIEHLAYSFDDLNVTA